MTPSQWRGDVRGMVGLWVMVDEVGRGKGRGGGMGDGEVGVRGGRSFLSDDR